MTSESGRKVVAITGGGSGLGRALALHYARQGYAVALCDRDGERAADSAQAVCGTGATADGVALDIRDEDGLRNWLSDVIARFGRLDLFVNNAGVCSAGSVADTALDDWQWMLDINLLGTVRGCRAALAIFRKQGFGHLLNVASFAAIANAPNMAAYNVAKAGVVSLSESLRGELHGTGIGITVACPSFFESNLAESFRAPDPAFKTVVVRLIEKSGFTAERIAADLAAAVARRQFLVIPQAFSRRQYWLKRLSSRLFLNLLLKHIEKQGRRRPAATKAVS